MDPVLRGLCRPHDNDIGIVEPDEFDDSRCPIDMRHDLQHDAGGAGRPFSVVRLHRLVPVAHRCRRYQNIAVVGGADEGVVVQTGYRHAQFLWQPSPFAALQHRGDAARANRRLEEERLAVQFGTEALGDFVMVAELGRPHEEEDYAHRWVGESVANGWR